MHQKEPELEVGVPGGHEERLQVIVHITFIILTVFLRIYKKDRCTKKSRSWRWEYLEGMRKGFR